MKSAKAFRLGLGIYSPEGKTKNHAQVIWFNYMAQDIFKQSAHSQAIIAPVLAVGLVLEVTAGPGNRF